MRRVGRIPGRVSSLFRDDRVFRSFRADHDQRADEQRRTVENPKRILVFQIFNFDRNYGGGVLFSEGFFGW